MQLDLIWLRSIAAKVRRITKIRIALGTTDLATSAGLFRYSIGYDLDKVKTLILGK